MTDNYSVNPLNYYNNLSNYTRLAVGYQVQVGLEVNEPNKQTFVYLHNFTLLLVGYVLHLRSYVYIFELKIVVDTTVSVRVRDLTISYVK